MNRSRVRTLSLRGRQAWRGGSRIVRALLVLVALLVIASTSCAFVLLRSPGWYAPPDIATFDRAAKQSIRKRLIDAEQAFTEALRSSKDPFVYHIDQDDLNRVIAARRDIYPRVEDVVPVPLIDPYIHFDDGIITLSGRCRVFGMEPVLSLDVAPTVDGGVILLRPARLRCGSMPAPLEWLPLPLDRQIDESPEAIWPGSPAVSGTLRGGLRIDAAAWWHNGGRNYRVLDVTVEPGVLHLRVQPLGQHTFEKDNRHH